MPSCSQLCWKHYTVILQLTVNTEQMCVVGPTSGEDHQDTEYPEKTEIIKVIY